ncbi:hypothetical protein B0H10DRAFT_2189634 [Mycena sp. CBHHK59/15]|nr:hypothetical protein B0H10DRAFT_2189634 [Mycena sp. CBHHK59/15]
MPRGLIVQRDIVENFPSSKQRCRRHIPFVQLRADVESGADNLIPDDEDEPANGNVAELTCHLNELPDDGDAREDDLPEPEIAEVIRRPAIQLHFGTEELYEFDKIFTEASINAFQRPDPRGDPGSSQVSSRGTDPCLLTRGHDPGSPQHWSERTPVHGYFLNLNQRPAAPVQDTAMVSNSGVCLAWRNLLLHIPDLWCNIIVGFLVCMKKSEMSQLLEFVKLWLSRSPNSLITSVAQGPAWPEAPGLGPAWQGLGLLFSKPKPKPCRRASSPGLRPRPGLPRRDLPPVSRFLAADCLFGPRAVALNLSETISASGNVAEKVLQQPFHRRKPDFEDVWVGGQARAYWARPGLQILKPKPWAGSSLLPWITPPLVLPALQALELRPHATGPLLECLWSQCAYAGLLERSAFTLHRFTIWHYAITHADLGAVLRGTPSLTELHLCLYKTATCYTATMRTLAAPQAAGAGNAHRKGDVAPLKALCMEIKSLPTVNQDTRDHFFGLGGGGGPSCRMLQFMRTWAYPHDPVEPYEFLSRTAMSIPNVLQGYRTRYYSTVGGVLPQGIDHRIGDINIAAVSRSGLLA